MEGLIKPFRIAANASPIANSTPDSSMCRIACKPDVFGWRSVIPGSLGREPYQYVGITFAGFKTFTETNDKNVFYANVLATNFLIVNSNLYERTDRVGNIEFN